MYLTNNILYAYKHTYKIEEESQLRTLNTGIYRRLMSVCCYRVTCTHRHAMQRGRHTQNDVCGMPTECVR